MSWVHKKFDCKLTKITQLTSRGFSSKSAMGFFTMEKFIVWTYPYICRVYYIYAKDCIQKKHLCDSSQGKDIISVKTLIHSFSKTYQCMPIKKIIVFLISCFLLFLCLLSYVLFINLFQTFLNNVFACCWKYIRINTSL